MNETKSSAATKLPYVLRVNPLIIVFSSLLLVLVPFFIWANFAYLEQKSTTTGVVVTTASTQKMQAPIEGVINKVYVGEGDLVKEGTVLFSLEQQQNQAALDAVAQKIASLRVRLERLRAEALGNKLIYEEGFVEPRFAEFIEMNLMLYRLRKTSLNDQNASLARDLELNIKELNLNKPLVEAGDIGANVIISMQKRINQLKGEIRNNRNQFKKDAQEEMSRVNDELSLQREIFIEKRVHLERSVVVAQMDAIVKEVLVTTKGAKVRPGDVILTLVPQDDEFIVRANLKPADITFIKIGQRAYMKFDAYDFTVFGLFNGRVEYLSPDTIKERTGQGEEYFFRVHISIDGGKLISKAGRELPITPGMGVQVDIVTGKRTVLQYLTKPITKVLDESFKER